MMTPTQMPLLLNIFMTDPKLRFWTATVNSRHRLMQPNSFFGANPADALDG
jgi:hypothetical protein